MLKKFYEMLKTKIKKTKIICSIGPACYDPDIMEQMVLEGMNVARVNFSHATDEEKQKVLDAVHEVRRRTGRNIAILYDTKGPEFRSGKTLTGEINLVEGKTIRVVKKEVLGTEEAFSVNHPQAIDCLSIGDVILLENGLMKIQVEAIDNEGVTCRILNGGILGDRKSLNVPGIKLNIPFISEVDKQDLIYACEHEGDFVALSFVNTPEDVLEARQLFKEHGREDMVVISKIESTTGVKNLDEIIDVSDGIMVARGDLGVEVPIQELPIVQKMIIEKCREKGKFCIVATEMLESMKKNPRPTRAEVSDIANAVFNGTDAIMLSGETTMGKYPIETVRYMAEIAENAERYYDYNKTFAIKRNIDIPETIAKSVVESAKELEIKVIVAASMSGYSARKISNLKPNSTILATVPSEQVARKLALNWGVYPVVVSEYANTDEVVSDGLAKAKQFISLEKGDKVIITGGFPNTGAKKTTNFMKIEEIQ